MSVEKTAEAFFRGLQTRICDALAQEDGAVTFGADEWQREGGGGGVSRVIADGAVFEKGGVNFSSVHGQFTPEFAAQMPGEGLDFTAAGVSLVLHPKNPHVPTVHANFRCITHGSALWFGGGADLTPYYPVKEDVVHFHATWKRVCDAHDRAHYPRFKKWCDEYFYLPHRGETRGIGGIFFDNLPGTEANFAFVKAAGDTFVDAYLPIVKRRRQEPFSEREREFQLYRRGRYVEFNLIYDRGTIFGLKTNGRTESILMSLPPIVKWGYDVRYDSGTREANLADWLKPTEWLAP